MANRGLVAQAYFPKAALPIAALLACSREYAYGVLVLVAMSFLWGVSPSPQILWWPVIFAVQFTFTSGLAIFAAAFGVFFRDLRNVLELVFRVVFYLSATMYDIGRIPESFRSWFRFNPLYLFYESYRGVLLHAQAPDLARLSIVFVAGLLCACLSLRFMSAKEGTFVKYL